MLEIDPKKLYAAKLEVAKTPFGFTVLEYLVQREYLLGKLQKEVKDALELMKEPFPDFKNATIILEEALRDTENPYIEEE